MNLKKLYKTHKQLIIAEIGQGHDGSLNYVHSFIDEAAKSGADLLKFQCHYADEESTHDDYFRTFSSYKKESRFQYWKRMEFTKEEWAKIYQHTKQKKMLFSSSVFSLKSIEIMKKIGIDVWKVASGESLNLYLVKEITKISSKPVFISTGMSFLEEVENIYNFMKKKKNEFLLMHCTSQYPCDFKNLGIGILKNYINHFKCPIGYSDHSGTLDVSLLALESKINALEVHVTFNKKIFNPDASSSIDFKELKFLSNYVKNKAEILKFSTTKNDITNRIKNIRKIFSKSLALRKDMKKNSIITLKDLMFKKPGNGLKEHDIKKIIGKKLLLNKSKNRLIKLSDVN
jgi:N-acetylneuraminate synthase